MNDVQKLIVDGETLLNHWVGLEDLENTNLYVSYSNFILCIRLLTQSLNFLSDYPDKRSEYVEAHQGIIDVMTNDEILKAFAAFADTTDPYLNNISVYGEDQNLNIVVYKGLVLAKAPGDEVDPTIDETIAYAEYKKQHGEPIPIFTMSESILEFIKTFNLDIEFIDSRLD